MANPLVLLVLVMTTLLSSLLSPASGQFSFRGFGGSNEDTPVPLVGAIPPGGVLEISLSYLDNNIINTVCIRETLDDCSIGDTIPPGTQLKSTNPDVASVIPIEDCPVVGEPVGPCIVLMKPGATVLKLLQNDEVLVSYILVVTPSFPGTRCAEFGAATGILDCSGTCVSREEVRQRLGDGVCDNGTERQDGREPLDLSCVFLPEFFLTEAIFEDLIDVIRIDRDGGDCSPKESCEAQFGDAPDFKFCSGTANLCFFNATTGFDSTTGRGTCTEMCQQFGSRCVAALDNDSPGCTPSPNSRDTCQTRRETEICVCERR